MNNVIQHQSELFNSTNQVETGNQNNMLNADNHNLNTDDEYLEIMRKLKLELADKKDECELLKIKLNESNQDVEALNKELDECKLTMFENNENSKRTHEEVMKSKKLEEDCVKLMSDLLDLREQSDHYRQNLIDNYLAKTNAINNYECFMTSGALKHELDQHKLDLNDKIIELSLAQAKVRNLEEENVTKEKSVTDLKKALDDAKVTHKHEIIVLEEYIHCLKNTISSYEKTLATYDETGKSQDSIDR